jgi:hypothetical protein
LLKRVKRNKMYFLVELVDWFYFIRNWIRINWLCMIRRERIYRMLLIRFKMRNWEVWLREWLSGIIWIGFLLISVWIIFQNIFLKKCNKFKKYSRFILSEKVFLFLKYNPKNHLSNKKLIKPILLLVKRNKT